MPRKKQTDDEIDFDNDQFIDLYSPIMIRNGLILSESFKQLPPKAAKVFMICAAMTTGNVQFGMKKSITFPSVEAISEYAGMSEQEIQDSLDELVKHGFLTKPESKTV